MNEKATTGKAWRKAREEGYLITLPSGNVARLRPVALDVLITSGQLPDVLTLMAASHLWSDQEYEPGDIAKQSEMAKDYADLINAVIPAAMLSPRVVDEPDADDEITLDDIEFADKIAVFNLSTAGATALRGFRDKQARDVEIVPNGQTKQPKAKQPG